ncbi:S49 family peptidase [Escherichia coli]
MRPSLDIEQVATGEHWYGQQAVEKGLVDEMKPVMKLFLA